MRLIMYWIVAVLLDVNQYIYWHACKKSAIVRRNNIKEWEPTKARSGRISDLY